MPENTQPSDDYISLGSIKKIFLDAAGFTFRLFEFFISSIQRNLLVFIACCLIGIGAGYIYYWQTPRYFQSEMIVRHNDLNRKAYYEIIRNLNDLLASQSYSNFSTELKLEKNDANKITSLEAIGINNDVLSADTSTKVGEPFKIIAKTSDNTSFYLLQKALLSYLNNNPYLKLTKEGQKRIYLEKLTFIERELQKLDSLKENYNVALASQRMPTTFYNNALNPAELYAHSFNLATERESILKWLNNEAEAVLLIDGFKSPANPKSASLALSLSVGLALGIVIGIITALLMALKNILK